MSMHIYPHRFKSQHILPKQSQEGQKFEICTLYNYMVTTESEPPPSKSLQTHLPLQNHKLGVLNTIKNESLQNWLPSLEQNLW